MNRLMFSWVVLMIVMRSDPCVADERIRNDSAWTDTDGNEISCHDGGITRVGDTFYWYGTSYRGNPTGLWGRKAAHLQQGFNCFLSTSGKTTIALKSDGRQKRYEGAALIRYEGKYIAAGSGVEGWNPTDTSYAVSFDPATGAAKMLHVKEWDPWK